MPENQEKFNINKLEEEILKFWQENKIFEKSVEKPAGKKPKDSFVFYDGPPFATGLPHYGHILASIIKDAVPRYQTMKGKKVPRRWGWDCHGLPIENEIEKKLGLKTKKDIERIGVEKFNEAAEGAVLEYRDEWKKIIPRVGRWVDMENDYKTMDWTYTESVWWVFKSLFDKGLIYEGYKPMHICPRCETTLANFEVTQGYKDITDISVVAKFELLEDSKTQNLTPKTYILAWTTTPWTLPGNVALAVNKDIVYCKIKSQISNLKNTSENSKLKNNEVYILAKARLSDVLKGEEYEIISEFKGKDLIGKKYKPLFNYYAEDKNLKNREKGWKIYDGDFVTTEEGTGIVHIAPAFGEDDMKLAQKYDLPFIQHVSMDGKFKTEVKDFAGIDVKPKDNHQSTDIEIIKWLAANNKLFKKEKIIHAYPHCWRCDTPLLNYAAASWFVKVEEIKNKLIANNKKINWIPEHIKEGRFGKWLEGARDWAISRSRFWGAPLPVWRCDKCEKIKVIGSIKELGLGKDGKIDLHRPHIDEIKLQCSCGGEMRRVAEVFDCWFESGSMPYAQAHYPFENNKKFGFPAEFIAEGLDQTRGWFYTLLVLSTGLFNKSAYKNVIVNGTILAEDGQKMSKRLKNYPDPMEIVEKYGADALRLYLLSSPAVRAENLNFSEKGVDEVYKKIILRLWNVYKFYELYADKNLKFKIENLKLKNILDKWILTRLNQLIFEASEAMNNYEIDKAARPLGEFVDDLSVWYIRRSRERFKKEGEDKQNALATTLFVLSEFSKILAPFAPFIAETIFMNLGNKNSVHLAEWPKISSKFKVKSSKLLMEAMAEARKICSLGLEARQKAGIKVRQPLQKLKVKSSKLKSKKELLDLIKDEINVKEIIFDDKIQNEVEIDTRITPELKVEGNLRELIRAIQDLRKKVGLKPEQKIILEVQVNEAGLELIKKFENEIKNLTGVKKIELGKIVGGEEIKIDELEFRIKIDL